MEGCLLILRNCFHFAVKLRGGCLINAACISQPAHPDRFKDPQHSGCIDVGSRFRNIKGNLNMTLCSQVIDFVRFDAVHNSNHAH